MKKKKHFIYPRWCQCLLPILFVFLSCSQDREKQFISRGVILELVNALKFKSSLPDINLIQLVQFVLLDAGGKLSDFINPGGGILNVSMDQIECDAVSTWVGRIYVKFVGGW